MSTPRNVCIGILVPSSNTALEPLTTAILSSIKTPRLNVTGHFSRFRVTTISLSSSALSQFDLSKMLDAAELLADAEVDVIGWGGTSAGWLGFGADDRLCRAIEERTGIKATTSVLGLNKALEKLGVKRLGLVTPYTLDVQNAIVKAYQDIGVEIKAERHLSRTDNVNLAVLGSDTFDPMVQEVAREEKVDAITTFCTNLSLAESSERWEVGMPVLNTVTTVIWDALRISGIETTECQGWGRIMRLSS